MMDRIHNVELQENAQTNSRFQHVPIPPKLIWQLRVDLCNYKFIVRQKTKVRTNELTK